MTNGTYILHGGSVHSNMPMSTQYTSGFVWLFPHDQIQDTYCWQRSMDDIMVFHVHHPGVGGAHSLRASRDAHN